MSEAALITGSSKRIGKSIALCLARCGYDIALHYNSSRKDAVATRKEIIKSGVTCELFRADLSRPSNCATLLDRVYKKCPHLSLLVNNASVFEQVSFGEVNLNSFDREFNINFKSPFFLTQAFASKVKKGNVINLLDARITKVHTGHFVYNLTKKALEHFTLMAAKELGPGIRVNAICPGPILPSSAEGAKALRKIALKTPLKKAGDTGYINSAVKYLLESKYVTGEILFIDGGQHL